jgi:hypothetical protein
MVWRVARAEAMTTPLDAIRARLAAATPGPWFWVEPHAVIHRIVDDPRIAHVEVPVAAIEGLFSMRHRNGDFIAHAPADIAALLAVAQAAEALLAAQDAARAEAERAVKEAGDPATAFENRLMRDEVLDRHAAAEDALRAALLSGTEGAGLESGSTEPNR